MPKPIIYIFDLENPGPLTAAQANCYPPQDRCRDLTQFTYREEIGNYISRDGNWAIPVNADNTPDYNSLCEVS
jgi:hypothetical protein